MTRHSGISRAVGSSSTWLRVGLCVAALGGVAGVACTTLPDSSKNDHQLAKAHERWTEHLDPKSFSGGLKPAEAVAKLASNRKKAAPKAAKGGKVGKSAIAEADRLLASGYKKGKETLALKPPINWGVQPRADSSWSYHINALSPVSTLIRAHEASKNPKYLKVARDLVLDWIDYNLVKGRDNERKWHSMAAGRRARPLAYVLDQELRAAKPDPDAVARLVHAIYEHVRFLGNSHNLAAGQHGVTMLIGLRWLIEALPEVREKERYLKYSKERMQAFLKAEFSKDGFHTGHTPSLHRDLTQVLKGADDTGLFSDVPELKQTVKAALRHVEELYHPNGYMVAVGDGSRQRLGSAKKGKGKARGKGKSKGKAAQATPGAAKGKTPDVQAKVKAPDPKKIGEDLSRKADKAAPAKKDSELAADALRAYMGSGYAAYRSHWGKQKSALDDYLFFAPAHTSQSHKQADHFSFEWSLRGVPILTDSGRYTTLRDKWQEFFLSTRAGNAVEIDGKNYTRSTKAPQLGLVAAGHVGDVYFAQARRSHPRLKAKQTRLLAWVDGEYLIVIDQMTSDTKSDRTYRQWFHFHESLTAEAAGGSVRVKLPKEGGTLHVAEISAAKEDIELVRGQTKPRIQGYFSPKLKKKLKRFSLGFTRKAQDTAFVTVFHRGAILTPSVQEAEGKITVRFSTPTGKRRGFVYSPREKEPLAALK